MEELGIMSALTQGEKRQQKADLLMTCQEADQEVAELCERISALRATLLEVGTVLEEVKPKNTTCGVPEVEQRLERIRAARLERVKIEPKYREAMNLDSVLLMVDLLERAKLNLRHLQERKTALGLK